ncbi:MAG: translocation/assembly module TamB, partial [Sphingomonadales bacterium]|nr:translocation/assembly module TamB [Sphingomonadales bacterium]
MAKWIAGLAAAVLAIFAAAVLVVDTDIGHRWVADRIADVRTPSGLRFSVGRIDGSLYSRATLRDLRVYDLDGLVFSAPVAKLDWAPLRWFANKLDIEALDIPVATFAKWPRTRPSANTGPLLPDFDIRIGRLTVDRLIVDRRVTGVLRYGRVRGTADIHAGRALVDLTAMVQGSDTLRLRIDAEPDRDRFDIAVRARATKDGVLARLTGIARPLRLDVGGVGSWARWDGHARATAGDTRVIDLALGNRRGRYTLSGDLDPAAVSGGKLARLTTPRVTVNGAATLANRRLAGNLDLRSAALAVETTGTIDLGANAFRNVRIRARLLKPAALFPNMTGRDVELRAILDGAFATAAFDFRLSAPRFAFDDTGFEQAWAAGKGRLSKSPIVLPVHFTAARVTGVGDVAGGILRNLTVDGVLRITSRLVTGDDLRVKSDKLTGRVNLTLDLATGDYQLGINGALGRYLIPGLGVVDVTSTLRVVPGPGGHGTRVIGQGAARVVRLDNAFFRSLAGGLPRIATTLERTP